MYIFASLKKEKAAAMYTFAICTLGKKYTEEISQIEDLPSGLQKMLTRIRINGYKEEMESFVNDHFRELSGKLFHFSGTLIMALEKGHADSTKIHQLYSTQFSKHLLPLPF